MITRLRHLLYHHIIIAIVQIAMDLARQIVVAAEQALEAHRAKRAHTVLVSMWHGRYEYHTTVVPELEHVLIRYNSLEYRVPRSDKEGFKNVMECIELDLRRDILKRAKELQLDVFARDYDRIQSSVDPNRHKVVVCRQGSKDARMQVNFQ